MIRFFLSWTEAMAIIGVGVVAIVLLFQSSIAIIKRNLRYYAEPKTQKMLRDKEAELAYWQRVATDRMKRNRVLSAALRQSAIYDKQINEYVQLRVQNEQDAAILGIEEEQ